VGKLTRHALTAGQVVVANVLEAPRDVTKGETIRVLGIAGQAVVSFDGIAEASGNKGETILIHNPSSGRVFRAVVEDKGRVVVRPTSGD
jgi:flagella basal body P-ring formation protein FlgA